MSAKLWDLIINGLLHLHDIMLLNGGICGRIHSPELHKMFLINIIEIIKKFITVAVSGYLPNKYPKGYP